MRLFERFTKGELHLNRIEAFSNGAFASRKHLEHGKSKLRTGIPTTKRLFGVITRWRAFVNPAAV